MPASTEGRSLVRQQQRPIILLALVALLVAEAASGVHVLRHLGAQDDLPGLPGHHAQACLECVGFVPLGALHGGGTTVFVIATLAGGAIPAAAGRRPEGRGGSFPFRSRAPPC
jgi:hypothetical protein